MLAGLTLYSMTELLLVTFKTFSPSPVVLNDLMESLMSEVWGCVVSKAGIVVVVKDTGS